MMSSNSMDECPKCGCISIHVKVGSIKVSFDKKDGGISFSDDKYPAECGAFVCTEKFYFYPKTGRITKRGK